MRVYPAVRAGVDESIADRIKRHVIVDDNGCWIWQRFVNPVNGYGQMGVKGRSMRTHRAAYEAFVGPIPEGLSIDHLCRVRACCNPEHLEPVSTTENVVVRGVGITAINATKTHCKRDHEFTPENTYKWRGKRHCRACHRLRDTERRQRRIAERTAAAA